MRIIIGAPPLIAHCYAIVSFVVRRVISSHLALRTTPDSDQQEKQKKKKTNFNNRQRTGPQRRDSWPPEPAERTPFAGHVSKTKYRTQKQWLEF